MAKNLSDSYNQDNESVDAESPQRQKDGLLAQTPDDLCGNTTVVNIADISVDDQGDTGMEESKRSSKANDIYAAVVTAIVNTRKALNKFYQTHRRGFNRFIKLFLLTCYLVFFICALNHELGDEGSIRLIVVTSLFVVGWLYYMLKKKFGGRIYAYCAKLFLFAKRHNKHMKRLTVFVVCGLLAAYIIVDVIIKHPSHLVPCGGILIFVTFMFVSSHDPAKVKWRPVLWGLLLQFIFGLIVLRTTVGYVSFNWLSERVVEYLAYTDKGSAFVFGEKFRDHFFAFRVMPTIVFSSATISILYYIGWMQFVVRKIAFIMQCSLGTAPMESLHAAANIFVGWGEAVLIVRPFLEQLPLSEIHTVMTNGFATVAGSLLGVYILYGAPANHLMSASFMSAPAALAMSKLFWPDEDVDEKDRRKKAPEMPSMGRNIIDAASAGAVSAITICSHIVVSFIAYLSLLAFVNATLIWFGERVGVENLTFQFLCSYLFWPLVFVMGVPAEDCRIVARMVGIKIFVNELVAYSDLGTVNRNRISLQSYNGSWHWEEGGDILLEDLNATLTGGIISPRSEMIATYALCGFSNIVGIGTMIGALSAVAPSRKHDFIHCALRAFLSGNMACFLTACIAGFIGGEK